MRGSRPGFWRQYEASQLGVAAACMTQTKRAARPAVTPAYQVATTTIAPPAARVFVVGPTIGSLNGRRVFHQ